MDYCGCIEGRDLSKDLRRTEMEVAINTMGLTEEVTFGTLTAKWHGEEIRLQGKFSVVAHDKFGMFVKKWDAKTGSLRPYAPIANVVSWEVGKRNNVEKTKTALYIGECVCGYKTRKYRNPNDVIAYLEDHQVKFLHFAGDVEEVK
jgi:hypothetical protein